MREDYVLIRVPDGSLAYLTALLVAADRYATAVRRARRAVDLDMGVRLATVEACACAQSLLDVAAPEGTAPAKPPPTPDAPCLSLPAGMHWRADHHGGWEVRDASEAEAGCVVRQASGRYGWADHGKPGAGAGERGGIAADEASACLLLARSMRATHPR